MIQSIFFLMIQKYADYFLKYSFVLFRIIFFFCSTNTKIDNDESAILNPKRNKQYDQTQLQVKNMGNDSVHSQSEEEKQFSNDNKFFVKGLLLLMVFMVLLLVSFFRIQERSAQNIIIPTSNVLKQQSIEIIRHTEEDEIQKVNENQQNSEQNIIETYSEAVAQKKTDSRTQRLSIENPNDISLPEIWKSEKDEKDSSQIHKQTNQGEVQNFKHQKTLEILSEKKIWEGQILGYMVGKNELNLKKDKTFLKVKINQTYEYQTMYTSPDIIEYQEITDQKRSLLTIQDPKLIRNHIETMNKAGKLRKQANFGYQLYLDPENPLNKQAQYSLYDKLYNISQYSEQLPICVISAGRNLVRKQNFLEFFSALGRQNYSNFHVVIGDADSEDYTFEVVNGLVKGNPKLKTRTTILHFHENIGALGNKDTMIRNYCFPGEIIVDLDADDSLIGSQAFKAINARYQATDKWFIYSNYLYLDQVAKQGYSKQIPEQVWEQNTYRIAQPKIWGTTHLRTFKRDLYMKIPFEHFFEAEGIYYLWASDRFIMYAITELAGKQKTQYFPMFLYYYNRTGAQRSPCDWSPMQYDQWKSRIHTPFAPLKDLEDHVGVIKGYQLSHEVKEKYFEAKEKYRKCLMGLNN